ncbi:hypothetical protein [Pantoea sp. C2G6]|uniref:hypothetical protein n=1 Tax=Pantoea sp. C2G6 TaxID=3243084 RepID=UPI003EDAD385
MPEAQAAKVDVNPQLGQICKATAAMTFGRDYKIMKLDKVDPDGIAYVYYNRPSDNTRWAIKCRLEGERVMWASDNPDSTGRWRNNPADEVITYSINGKKLNLKQVYSDGSGDNATYDLK